jgi:ribosomal protein L25 (general stress protein Ctc)
MSNYQELKSAERDTTLTPRQLRAAGFVPATLYGKGTEPKGIQVKTHDFHHLYLQGHRTFKLTGFVNATVMLQAVQVDPVHQEPISLQFHLNEGGSPGKAAKAKKEPALAGV